MANCPGRTGAAFAVQKVAEALPSAVLVAEWDPIPGCCEPATPA